MAWLRSVQARSSHPSVEKTVRVLCDYYRKLTSDKPGLESELFWRNRTGVTARRSRASLGDTLPGNHLPSAEM